MFCTVEPYLLCHTGLYLRIISDSPYYNEVVTVLYNKGNKCGWLYSEDKLSNKQVLLVYEDAPKTLAELPIYMDKIRGRVEVNMSPSIDMIYLTAKDAVREYFKDNPEILETLNNKINDTNPTALPAFLDVWAKYAGRHCLSQQDDPRAFTVCEDNINAFRGGRF